MRLLTWFLDVCYCMIIPEDEYKRENTDNTIVPTDFTQINENNHQNPFDTDNQLSQFIRNT